MSHINFVKNSHVCSKSGGRKKIEGKNRRKCAKKRTNGVREKNVTYSKAICKIERCKITDWF